MYQLDRSSEKAAKAAVTSGVQYRSYAPVASRTSWAVRAASQRSSGFSSPPSDPGFQPAMFAYVMKNETEFQKVRSSFLTSSAIP